MLDPALVATLHAEAHAARWGVDLPARNGSGSFELPLPAAFLVGRDGIVREAFVEPDYRLRLEPDTALGWIDRHFGAGAVPG